MSEGTRRLFMVNAVEKFTRRTTYYVSANSPEEAERKCKEGEASYDSSSPVDGGDEWVKTVDVLDSD